MSIEDFFNSLTGKKLSEANSITESICGIEHFFETSDFRLDFGDVQTDKTSYGDWQTDFRLAEKVCLLLKDQGVKPEIIIEPTCGTGSFILAACTVFGTDLKQIYGIELHKPYINRLKLRILQFALENPVSTTCKIKLFHQSVFDFNFENLHIAKDKNVLILGNPPWVTNSKQGKMKSSNLPEKSNFKNIKGIESITGKSNFDISESITCKLLDNFHRHNAHLAFLIKCAAVKNIVFEQKNGKYQIDSINQYNINAQKEFGVSVAACLLVLRLGKGQSEHCVVQDFYHLGNTATYGWAKEHFVANMEDYSHTSFVDGICQINWRSGMKHDCSKVMELVSDNGRLFNKLHEPVDIESDLVFPFLKSSDLKGGIIDKARRYVIVTQSSTSDDTENIRNHQPLTYRYLEEHTDYFNKRGSVIYKKRPKFCIFGIGPYSFKKYKIAIAGLSKTTTFSLICPTDGKCAMLDDTCYLMGFDTLEDAKCILKILNSNVVQRFLQSLIFYDAKRSINKDTLMRIDLLKAAVFMLKNHELSERQYQQATAIIKRPARTSSIPLRTSLRLT